MRGRARLTYASCQKDVYIPSWSSDNVTLSSPQLRRSLVLPLVSVVTSDEEAPAGEVVWKTERKEEKKCKIHLRTQPRSVTL
jgi:hypothetical protein